MTLCEVGQHPQKLDGPPAAAVAVAAAYPSADAFALEAVAVAEAGAGGAGGRPQPLAAVPATRSGPVADGAFLLLCLLQAAALALFLGGLRGIASSPQATPTQWMHPPGADGANGAPTPTYFSSCDRVGVAAGPGLRARRAVVVAAEAAILACGLLACQRLPWADVALLCRGRGWGRCGESTSCPCPCPCLGEGPRLRRAFDGDAETHLGAV